MKENTRNRTTAEHFILSKQISVHSKFAVEPKIVFRGILISRLAEKTVFRGILFSRFLEVDRETAKVSCRESFMQ